MAKLPTTNKILREDLKEAPAWIEKLLYPLNRFFEDVYNALSNKLTFEENFVAAFKEITFTTQSGYVGTAATFTQIEFPRPLKVKPKGLLPVQVTRNEDNYTAVEGGVHVDWRDDNGVIKIACITGLVASKNYTIRLLLF